MMDEKDGRVMVRTKDSEAKEPEQVREELEQEDVSPQEKPLEEMSREELMHKVFQVQEISDKHYDMYLRTQAETENIKKRFRKEKEDWIKYSNESLIKELLQVLDHLELAVAHADNQTSYQALKEGVELTLKGLRDTLEKAGLEQVKALGEMFDPNFHQAVAQEEDPKAEEGTIIRELQKGYILNQRLIRPAMVIVSKGSPEHPDRNADSSH
jgi:molecular chaperone GrpE